MCATFGLESISAVQPRHPCALNESPAAKSDLQPCTAKHQDGDGVVIPIVSRREAAAVMQVFRELAQNSALAIHASPCSGDEASFNGLNFDKTLQRYHDSCEAESREQRGSKQGLRHCIAMNMHA